MWVTLRRRCGCLPRRPPSACEQEGCSDHPGPANVALQICDSESQLLSLLRREAGPRLLWTQTAHKTTPVTISFPTLLSRHKIHFHVRVVRWTPDVRRHIENVCPCWLGVANTITNTLAEHAPYYATLRLVLCTMKFSRPWASFQNSDTVFGKEFIVFWGLLFCGLLWVLWSK